MQPAELTYRASAFDLLKLVAAGMDSVISSFLNSSVVDADMNAIAANLAGISHSLLSTPFLGSLEEAVIITKQFFLSGRAAGRIW